jgi:signal transduction histidine kinase
MSADSMLVGGARPLSPVWAMVWERLVACGYTLSANKTERRMVLLQWLVMPLVLAGCLLPIPRHGEQATHVFAAACVMLAHPLLYTLGGRVSSLRAASRTFALTATDVTVATLVFYTTAARPGYAQVLLYCAVALAATRYAPRRAFGIASLVALLLVFAALLPLHMALPTVASEILGLYALTGLVGLLSEAEKAVGAAAAENAYLARTVLQRNRELAALNRLSHTMNTASGAEDILCIGLAGMAEVLELRDMRAYLIEEGGAPEMRLVARMGDDEPAFGAPPREEDARAPIEDAIKAARSVEGLCLPAGAPVLAWEHVRASAPLLVRGRPVAVIQARLSRPVTATTDAMLETLQIFCGEVSLALENALLRGEAHRSAVLREKNRIAQELHDTVLQMLFSIGLRLQWSLDTLVEHGQTPSPLREPLEEARHLSARAGEEMRGAIFTLSSDIAEIGLVAAVRRLVDDQAIKAGWSANLVTTGEQPELPVLVQNAAHRVVREALMNSYKHAQASEVMVSVRFTSSMLTIVVQDNGVGVADAALASFRQTPDHFGLRTVAEQIESLGGAFSISSNDDERGTTVRATVPVDSR